jgi:hypothetical protein
LYLISSPSSLRHYRTYTGTGLITTMSDYKDMNGYSNNYYGWGCARMRLGSLSLSDSLSLPVLT